MDKDDIIYIAIIFLIIFLGWLSIGELRRSWRRARNAQRTLTAERDILELKVDAGNAALRESQTKWLAEISRTAEFGRLAEGLFHDLMTPLTSVALHMEKLKKIQPHESDNIEFKNSQAYLEKALYASERMGLFMKNIRRQMSREQNSDDHALTAEIVDVKKELIGSIDLLSYKARNTNVRIEQIANDHCTYVGNPLRLLQLFSNLISNAIDACETVGKISDREKIIRIDIKKETSQLAGDTDAIVITIADNGIGIPHDCLSKIFEPFFTTKSASAGTGIGLATVQKIVQDELHGSITVTSTENVGTEFRIIFPVKK